MRRFCSNGAAVVGAMLPVLVTLGAQAQVPAQASAVSESTKVEPPGVAATAPAATAPAATAPQSDGSSTAPVGGDSTHQVPAATVAAPAVVDGSPVVSPAPAQSTTAGVPAATVPAGASQEESGGATEVAPKTRFPWAGFLDVSPLWQRSRAFDFVSRNDLSWRLGITLERDLVALTGKDILSVDLGWSRESRSDTVFGDFQSEFDVHNFTLGLRLRRQWHPVLATHVSLLGGASRMRSRFGWGNDELDWLPVGQVGGGLSCQLPRVQQVQPGVLVEGGYFVSGSSDIRVQSDAATQSSFNYVSPDLGTFERSGPYLRFSLYLRY